MDDKQENILIESYNEAENQLMSIENDFKEEKSESSEAGDTAIEYNGI